LPGSIWRVQIRSIRSGRNRRTGAGRRGGGRGRRTAPGRVSHPGLDHLELIRFLQVAQAISLHHGALAHLLGINALRASEAAAVRIEDNRKTLRGHRVLQLVGKAGNAATMALTVPVLRLIEACRGERTEGPLALRLLSGKPIDGRDCYRMVTRIAKAAGIPRHISPHSLRRGAITNALDVGVPLRRAQVLARHADPRPRLRARETSTATASTSLPPISPAFEPVTPRPHQGHLRVRIRCLPDASTWPSPPRCWA
jgi:integrase